MCSCYRLSWHCKHRRKLIPGSACWSAVSAMLPICLEHLWKCTESGTIKCRESPCQSLAQALLRHLITYSPCCNAQYLWWTFGCHFVLYSHATRNAQVLIEIGMIDIYPMWVTPHCELELCVVEYCNISEAARPPITSFQSSAVRQCPIAACMTCWPDR